MKNKDVVGIWFQQIRGPFLILSVVLVLIGVASAYQSGYHNWLYSVMLLVGVVLAHISVNLFNELSDFKTRIDEFTVRTPFSGGSGMMQAGKTSSKVVSIVAYITMIIAAIIGFYFCLKSGWIILIFMVSGGIAIRFYTSHLSRWFIGEFVAGLTLGTFVVLGTYYAQASLLTLEVIFISIPPGILTSLLLLLNEFPDAEADKKGGRCHFIIHFGKEKSAGIYVTGLVILYVIILIAPFILNVPYTVLIALLTVPLAVKASIVVLKHNKNAEKLIPALAMNVGIVVITNFLLAAGYFL